MKSSPIRRPRAGEPVIARPTNRAGGLEGGVTNGEELRVTGFMKPISTLMKPLRSVDLTTLEEAPAAIERSDVCAVPAAAVVGEAMVGLVLADALLERFGGDSMVDLTPRVAGTAQSRTRVGASPVAAAAAPPGLTLCSVRSCDSGTRPAASRRAPVDAITPEIDTLIDDMIETMYAAPGIGLAAPQVGVSLQHLRDRSVARQRSGRADRDDQSRVRRARRHAARRRRLPQRPGLQRHGRPAQARRGPGPRPPGPSTYTIEGTGLLARALQHEIDHLNGVPVRRSAARHLARSDPAQDQEAGQGRQVVRR